MKLMLTAAVLLCSMAAFGQNATVEAQRAVKRHARDAGTAVRPFAPVCPPKTITIPASISGTLTTSTCKDELGLYDDVYAINVSAGQSIHVDFSSQSFQVFLYMATGAGVSADVSYPTAYHALFDYTFAQSGTYYIEAESADGNVGSYALSVTSANGGGPGGGTGTCTVDATTACLLNNRFKVNVRYRGAFDNNAADANAQLKQVTGFASPTFETAFFYFNSPNNIEMMIKMLDQGNTNSAGQPTIALLFGSATPLRMELTITDTKNGAVKTYTSAFASQAGKTDFTAFVK